MITGPDDLWLHSKMGVLDHKHSQSHGRIPRVQIHKDTAPHAHTHRATQTHTNIMHADTHRCTHRCTCTPSMHTHTHRPTSLCAQAYGWRPNAALEKERDGPLGLVYNMLSRRERGEQGGQTGGGGNEHAAREHLTTRTAWYDRT